MNTRCMTWAAPASARPSIWRMLVDRWTARLQERAEMASLSARERQDAGISAYDVGRECSKPFWQD